VKITFAYWTVALTGGLAGAFGCNSTPSGQPVVAQERHVRPPPIVRRPMHQPLLVASAVNSAPDTGASPIAGAVVDARALVITTDGTDAAFAAISSTLQYLGSPFDVLNATTGPALTADALASGTHGKYDAIFLDLGGLETSSGSAFTDDEWTTLSTYEAEFSVRRVALYTSPSSAYGLSDNGSIDPTQTPITMTCTAAGTSLFVGTNCANPITMNAGWAYPAMLTDTSSTPLLVDGTGNVYAAVREYPDGREAVALTFAQATYLTPYLQLAYGLVSWATRGLFVGERHVYAVPQIDDLFLASEIFTGGTYRITDADLQALADWQTQTGTQPLTAGFRLAWAVNGQGSQSMPGDPLTAKALVLGSTFSWINHSWDHPILDGLSYADVLTEFTRNDTYLRSLGLTPYATANAVTPSISGLDSADAMQAIHDAGIRQIVSDTSVAGQNNPSPNTGLWNALQPTVLEIPRIPTNLDYDVSQPSEWIPEYEATVSGGATVDYPTMIDQTSNDLLQDLLNGNNDPWMFHQANTRDYDGAGHSLLSDLLTATFGKYIAAASFPIVSPTMDDLAARVTSRMTFNASGVAATIQPQTSVTISVTAAATVPVTGLCVPGAESYGGQTIAYLPLAAGQSVTLSLTTCNPDYGAGGTGGASGTGGSSGGTGAGGIGVAGASGSTGGIGEAGGAGGTGGEGIAGAAGGNTSTDGGATGGSGGATGGEGAMETGGSSGGGGSGGTSGVTGAGGASESGEGGQAGLGSSDAAAAGTDAGGGAAGAPGGNVSAGAGCDCRMSGGTPSGGVLLLGLLGLVGALRTRRPRRS
jgi:MYXO-CTERM domain-containing protein